MTERIKILIEGDEALDAYLIRLDMVLQKSRQAFGTSDIARGTEASIQELGALMWGMEQADKTAQNVRIVARAASSDVQTMPQTMAGFSDEELRLIADPARLPAINREMRILLRQIPGMGEYMRLYFNIKRVQRGFLIGPQATLLAVLASLVILVNTLQQQQRKDRQDIEFFKQIFGDYFGSTADLNMFEQENRITKLEAVQERIGGFVDWFIDRLNDEEDLLMSGAFSSGPPGG